MKLFAIVMIGLVAFASNAADRQVRGDTVVSVREQHMTIAVPKGAHYVGAERWLLYNIADCDLHLFVDAGAGRATRKLYWIQFEKYVPWRPELHHRYNSPRHARIGGVDFYQDI